MKTLTRIADLLWVAGFGEAAPFGERSNIERMREGCLKGAVIGCLIGSAHGGTGVLVGCVLGLALCAVPFIVRDLRHQENSNGSPP